MPWGDRPTEINPCDDSPSHVIMSLAAGSPSPLKREGQEGEREPLCGLFVVFKRAASKEFKFYSVNNRVTLIHI